MQRSAARDETPATRSALPAPEAMIARAKALELNTPYVPPPGFALTEAYTSAFLVTYKGRLIAERYMSGIGPTTRLGSWSMGKGVVASLMGVLIQQGVYQLDQPAPIPEWQTAGDPRQQIRISALMHMSSGCASRRRTIRTSTPTAPIPTTSISN